MLEISILQFKIYPDMCSYFFLTPSFGPIIIFELMTYFENDFDWKSKRFKEKKTQKNNLSGNESGYLTNRLNFGSRLLVRPREAKVYFFYRMIIVDCSFLFYLVPSCYIVLYFFVCNLDLCEGPISIYMVNRYSNPCCHSYLFLRDM